MTDPSTIDGLDTQLCLGLIDYLCTLDPDLLTWSPSGAYPVGLTRPAAFLNDWPSGPDRVATFTPYPVADEPDQAQSTIGVQIRMRWAGANPRAVLNYRSVIFDELHGLANLQLGTVRISQVLHRSGASLGQDGSKRWAWSDNYYIDCDRPSSNRS